MSRRSPSRARAAMKPRGQGERQPREFDLGPVEFIPPGQGHAYVVAGRAIAVFRLRDGRLFATQSRCPHRNGPFADGLIGAGKVICPLHQWTFDLATGHCLGEDATVETYPAREADGRIIVQV